MATKGKDEIEGISEGDREGMKDEVGFNDFEGTTEGDVDGMDDNVGLTVGCRVGDIVGGLVGSYHLHNPFPSPPR